MLQFVLLLLPLVLGDDDEVGVGALIYVLEQTTRVRFRTICSDYLDGVM